MNKQQVSALLASNSYAVTKAMIILFAHQTAQERSTSSTIETNNVGFNAADADFGSYCARWVLGLHQTTPAHIVAERVARYLQGDNYKNYRCLSGRFLERGRAMGTRYWRQLAAAAEAKRAMAVPF